MPFSSLEWEGTKYKIRLDHLDVAASRKLSKTNRISKGLRSQFEGAPTGPCEL